jgi:hypothetical protein
MVYSGMGSARFANASQPPVSAVGVQAPEDDQNCGRRDTSKQSYRNIVIGRLAADAAVRMVQMAMRPYIQKIFCSHCVILEVSKIMADFSPFGWFPEAIMRATRSGCKKNRFWPESRGLVCANRLYEYQLTN